ncbi:hypothetical protein MAR_014873, partial [Mya arenaria]
MNKEEQKRLRETMPDWSRVVDPMTLTIDLPCLSETDKRKTPPPIWLQFLPQIYQLVQAVERTRPPSSALMMNKKSIFEMVVNDSIEVVSCNIGKVHTRQAREKHICEEHVDHSFEDRRNSVPRHLDGDDELDSIREKGKNKRWPGIDASCETKNSAFDDQDSVSWSSQSDSTSTQFGNKLTESLDNVLSPYSEQPRGVTGQGEDESFTNDCQNTRGDVTEVKEKDLPLNNEQPVNVIEQSVNECPIIGDDAAQSEENVLPPDFDQSRYLTRQRKDERLTNNRSSTGVEETQTESNIVPTNNDQSRDLTGPRVDEQLTNNLSITGIEASQAESNTVSSKEDQSG